MIPLEPSGPVLDVAERVVWFKKPEATLRDPLHFLAYAMQYGTARDWVALGKAGVGLEQCREVLDHAPPGVLDPRSWTYWNLKCGRTSVPPLPIRRFDH